MARVYELTPRIGPNVAPFQPAVRSQIVIELSAEESTRLRNIIGKYVPYDDRTKALVDFLFDRLPSEETP